MERKPFIIYENFLNEEELNLLWKGIKKSRRNFERLQIVIKKRKHRNAHVLYRPHAFFFYNLLAPKLLPALIKAKNYFNVKDILDFSDVECQCTRTGNGECFGMHSDIDEYTRDELGFPDRVLSYVFYFHMPDAFQGGELFIKPNYTLKMPHNSLILFTSDLEHEVKETQVEREDWLKARWTINGCVSRHSDIRKEPRKPKIEIRSLEEINLETIGIGELETIQL